MASTPKLIVMFKMADNRFNQAPLIEELSFLLKKQRGFHIFTGNELQGIRLQPFTEIAFISADGLSKKT